MVHGAQAVQRLCCAPMSIAAAYDAHDALGLAELVRQKEVSPQELLDEAIRRVGAA